MNDSTTAETTIEIERIFDAPVDLIWQMWTDPESFKNWYGPEGFSVPVAEMDVQVGGKHLFCMETPTPDGTLQMWSTGEYLEVVPPNRLVYTDMICDEHGNVTMPSGTDSNANHPPSTKVTVVLEDLGGRTRMVMTHEGLPEGAQGANEGWRQSFAKLGDYLESSGNLSA